MRESAGDIINIQVPEHIKALAAGKDDMTEHLGICFTSYREGYVEATMPADNRTCRKCRPVPILNGGASLALAESAAGFGSMLLCEKGSHPAGIQVSANHLRMVPFGQTVTAKAELIHKGSTLHLWEVNIFDEHGHKASTVRVTNMIVRESRRQTKLQD